MVDRKPGRPRSKVVNPKIARKLDTDDNSVTRFKIKSAEWVANEKFKCDVCGKVLSCRGELPLGSLRSLKYVVVKARA